MKHVARIALLLTAAALTGCKQSPALTTCQNEKQNLQQELAQAFGIRSIPTCVLMVGGKPVDGFMGAKLESEIKAFLDKHVPSSEVLEAESDAEDAQALLAAVRMPAPGGRPPARAPAPASAPPPPAGLRDVTGIE